LNLKPAAAIMVLSHLRFYQILGPFAESSRAAALQLQGRQENAA
jgi:hypothetical protein